MTPADFVKYILDPGLAFVAEYGSVPVPPAARVLLMAIAGQESDWTERLQIPVAYARSYFQFEKGGAVAGVLQHPASAKKIVYVCNALDIPCNVASVYDVMAWNDLLAVAMARLLLWTDPYPLPSVGDKDGAWNCYIRCWRPGAPLREKWDEVYPKAMALT